MSQSVPTPVKSKVISTWARLPSDTVAVTSSEGQSQPPVLQLAPAATWVVKSMVAGSASGNFFAQAASSSITKTSVDQSST